MTDHVKYSWRVFAQRSIAIAFFIIIGIGIGWVMRDNEDRGMLKRMEWLETNQHQQAQEMHRILTALEKNGIEVPW